MWLQCTKQVMSIVIAVNTILVLRMMPVKEYVCITYGLVIDVAVKLGNVINMRKE